MPAFSSPQVVVKLSDGLRFMSGHDAPWSVEPLTIHRGEWVALRPDREEPVIDPAAPLARVLATLNEPLVGSMQLLGQDIYRLDYSARQRLRSQVGFVHGYGGLLSNRTLRDNITLPVSVHGGLDAASERALIDKIIHDFALTRMQHKSPHEVDGSTRWRTCLARATALNPPWLVLEGLGNWEMDRGRGTGWRLLVDIHKAGRTAIAICLPRQNPGFESWFLEQGGRLARCRRLETIPPERPWA